MLRQALLMTLAAGGLTACSWGYEMPPPTAPAAGYASSYYGPLVLPPEAAYAYRGTQWGPWGAVPAAPPPPSAPPPPPATRQPFAGELTGPGVAILDDWLRETREGRAIVTLGFRDAGEGVVSEDVAHRANIWFRHYADHDRDMVLTDDEIRAALVAAASGYLGAPPPAQPG